MSEGETARIRVWLDRLHAGDEGALNELLVHFEKRLRSMTRRMLKAYPLVDSCEQTDDVFQKAVLRLCRALREVTPGSTRDLIRLSAAQIRRELLNLARFYSARPDLIRRAELSATPGGGPQAPDECNLLDQWAAFHEAAAALPEPGRETFDLIWYHGLTCEEVAPIQQVSERTVRNRWNAARLSICQSLEWQLPAS